MFVLHHCAVLLQDVLDLLKSGLCRGDGEILADTLVYSSLKQLGADTADVASYESMLLDAATVFYGGNAKAAVCAWQTVHEAATHKLRRLLDCSLVKLVHGQLWVHDVIKSIATSKALSENKQCRTRVWLADQVITVFYKINCDVSDKCCTCTPTTCTHCTDNHVRTC
jgi:hypothetical protein